MRYNSVTWLFLYFSSFIYAQETKKADALRIHHPISVDGVLDEPAYQQTWADQTNTLSLKTLYYIDYNSLTKSKG